MLSEQQRQLIQALRQLLARAEAGEIVGIAVHST